MTITGTHIAYYHLCHRKLWLLTQEIRMENSTNNQYVEEGKLINETSYQRRPNKWRELSLEGIKIDHFDAKNNLIREVKKTPKLEHAHIAQVKYYLYRLHRAGINTPAGIIEYPKQKRTVDVPFVKENMTEVEAWLVEIEAIAIDKECPAVINKPYCKKCAFYDFCYI